MLLPPCHPASPLLIIAATALPPGTLGHNNRTAWFQENIQAIFQADGLLGMYNQVSPLVLLHHFSVASNQARDLYDRHHSNDQSGAEHKDLPPWAGHFFICLKPSKMFLLLPHS
jgi:hypothetical protein